MTKSPSKPPDKPKASTTSDEAPQPQPGPAAGPLTFAAYSPFWTPTAFKYVRKLVNQLGGHLVDVSQDHESVWGVFCIVPTEDEWSYRFGKGLNDRENVYCNSVCRGRNLINRGSQLTNVNTSWMERSMRRLQPVTVPNGRLYLYPSTPSDVADCGQIVINIDEFLAAHEGVQDRESLSLLQFYEWHDEKKGRLNGKIAKTLVIDYRLYFVEHNEWFASRGRNSNDRGVLEMFRTIATAQAAAAAQARAKATMASLSKSSTLRLPHFKKRTRDITTDQEDRERTVSQRQPPQKKQAADADHASDEDSESGAAGDKSSHRSSAGGSNERHLSSSTRAGRSAASREDGPKRDDGTPGKTRKDAPAPAWDEDNWSTASNSTLKDDEPPSRGAGGVGAGGFSVSGGADADDHPEPEPEPDTTVEAITPAGFHPWPAGKQRTKELKQWPKAAKAGKQHHLKLIMSHHAQAFLNLKPTNPPDKVCSIVRSAREHAGKKFRGKIVDLRSPVDVREDLQKKREEPIVLRKDWGILLIAMELKVQGHTVMVQAVLHRGDCTLSFGIVTTATVTAGGVDLPERAEIEAAASKIGEMYLGTRPTVHATFYVLPPADGARLPGINRVMTLQHLLSVVPDVAVPTAAAATAATATRARSITVQDAEVAAAWVLLFFATDGQAVPPLGGGGAGGGGGGRGGGNGGGGGRGGGGGGGPGRNGRGGQSGNGGKSHGGGGKDVGDDKNSSSPKKDGAGAAQGGGAKQPASSRSIQRHGGASKAKPPRKK